MATINDFVKHIREFLTYSKIEKAIEGLLIYTEETDDDLYSQIVLQSSRYHTHKQVFRDGLTDNPHYVFVTNGLLDATKELKRNGEKVIDEELVKKIKQATKWDIETTPIPLNNETSLIPLTREEEEKKDLQDAIKVYWQQRTQLNSTSTKDERDEFIKSQQVLQNIFAKDFDNLAFINPEWKKTFAMEVAHSIYISEQIDIATETNIQKILNNEDEYKWYERSIIVSALALSSIHFPAFNLKKTQLLISFLNKHEPNVWERALVGLVLSLTYKYNRWHNKKNELERILKELQKLKRIQDACKIIDFILIHQLQEGVLFISQIFDKEFFKENPLHCFLPFYEGNPILQECLTHAEESIDATEFDTTILNLPYINPMKYFFTLGLKDKTTRMVQTSGKEAALLQLTFDTSTALNPFYNILCEYFVFYKYYPSRNHDNIFENQLCISQSKLKDLILSRITKLTTETYNLIKKEDYKSAINRLMQILEVEPEQQWALDQIAKCYSTFNHFNEALDTRKKIEKLYPKDYKNLNLIGEVLYEMRKYEQAFIYFERTKDIAPKYVDNLIDMATCLTDMKKYNDALVLFTEIENEYRPNPRNFYNKGLCYDEMKKYDMSLKYYLKAYEIKPKKSLYLTTISFAYMYLKDIQNALIHAEKAYELDKKDILALHTLGVMLWASKGRLDKAKQYLFESLKIEKSASVYGSLGHIFLSEDNILQAKVNYRKCIELFEDIEDFKDKFERGTYYILQYGISEELYKNICNEMVEYWYQYQKTKKKEGSGFQKNRHKFKK